MLMLASEISINVKNRRRIVIKPGAYDFDKNSMAAFNKERGTKHSVLPWVLQRFDGHYDDANPWTIWFRDLCENDVNCSDPSTRLTELEEELAGLRPQISSPHIIEIGVCADYVSRLNPHMTERVESRRKVTQSGYVAVHIRRGDATDEDLKSGDPGRKHFPLERYIEEMEKYHARGYDAFYLLTESQREIDRIVTHFEGRCKIDYQEVDRSKFPTAAGKDHDRANYMEFQCLDNPELVEFSMETALVDLDNAGRCDAVILSQSAFSKLAFLRSVGWHKQIVDHKNMVERSFGTPLVCPNLQENWGPSLFVIKERDVGFFSMLLQIVNILLYMRDKKLNAIPYVNFSDKQEYYTGTETWENFFEPLVFISRDAIEPLLQKVDKSFEAHLKEMKYWDYYGVIYTAGKNLIWSGSYYPGLHLSRFHSRLPLKPSFKVHHMLGKLANRRGSRKHAIKERGGGKFGTGTLISHMDLPTHDERRKASVVFGTYINLKPEIREIVDDLFKDYNDHYIIGVQFRGTDARKDARRAIPDYSDYVKIIQDHLDQRDTDDKREVFIFVASDEAEFIDYLSGQFDNVGYFDAVRHPGEDEEAQSDGKLGWGMPSFIRIDRNKALEGAILDFSGLCRAEFMIHNFGSLTNAVLLARPDMGNHLVGADYKNVEANKEG